MFILKDNSKNAVVVASYKEIKMLGDIGVYGIKKLTNCKQILTNLVNSNYLIEGSY